MIDEILKLREKYPDFNPPVPIKLNDIFSIVDYTVTVTKNAFTQQLEKDRTDKLIPRKVAMKQLNVSTTATMIAWEKKGYLIPHRIGSRVFYKSSQLKKAAEQFKRVTHE